ncbi:stemmadenine O-acetyltransferase-like [Jatropha curcas]|uniref:stemmadenine O-acetyltransferase-like n=1 Tax=Jatropha curcas TaxID=180498 RepID=UPI00189545C0|nr:stemmadenine O-acetyltransferase-like [Jatropha curcas]
MEVEIIFKSFVTPSSPMPTHLKTYKISLLDQFQPSLHLTLFTDTNPPQNQFEPSGYFSTILFYQNSQETSVSVLLKQSLSETLSRFYPLAGKVKDRLSIDCNDEGVCYIEATSNIPLSQYLAQPDLASLKKLMPNATRECELPSGSHVALIQETTFACGGFTIAVHVSHVVCDGASLFLFLKDWAAAACKSTVKHPYLDGESIFPQYAAFPAEASNLNTFVSFAKEGKHITKRIVFKESAIANLKAKASSNNINYPTRIEVVTAILSKCLMASFKNKTGIDKPLAITHVVNLRQKGEPPLPENLLGNYISVVGAAFAAEEEFSELVSRIREAIRNVGTDFLKKIQNGGEVGFFKYYEAMKEVRNSLTNPVFESGEMELAPFSSWCNFGIYDIDFGWGKPIWAACAVPFVHNSDILIILMDTRTYKGVEAWVYMKEDDLDFLTKDTELLQYASIDPSPVSY